MNVLQTNMLEICKKKSTMLLSYLNSRITLTLGNMFPTSDLWRKLADSQVRFLRTIPDFPISFILSPDFSRSIATERLLTKTKTPDVTPSNTSTKISKTLQWWALPMLVRKRGELIQPVISKLLLRALSKRHTRLTNTTIWISIREICYSISTLFPTSKSALVVPVLILRLL